LFFQNCIIRNFNHDRYIAPDIEAVRLILVQNKVSQMMKFNLVFITHEGL